MKVYSEVILIKYILSIMYSSNLLLIMLMCLFILIFELIILKMLNEKILRLNQENIENKSETNNLDKEQRTSSKLFEEKL